MRVSSLFLTNLNISSCECECERLLISWHFTTFCQLKRMKGWSRGKESHLKTITIISRVSSYTFSMLIFWGCASICILSKLKYLFSFSICISGLCSGVFVFCTNLRMKWRERGRLSSPLMFSINFKSVLQFPSLSRFQFLQTLLQMMMTNTKIATYIKQLCRRHSFYKKEPLSRTINQLES